MKFNRIGIAKKLIQAEKYERAKKLLRYLAEKDNSDAQHLLGYLCHAGDPKTSTKEAIYWLEKTAYNGNEEALHQLGVYFVLGAFKTRGNALKVVKKLITEAKKGNAKIQLLLSHIYDFENLGLYNPIKSIYWCTMAASQNYGEAQIGLGNMWLYGRGVEEERNLKKAIYWFERCANNAHRDFAEFAKEGLIYIYKGKVDSAFTNKEKLKYWENQLQPRVHEKSFRFHPDWFYN